MSDVTKRTEEMVDTLHGLLECAIRDQEGINKAIKKMECLENRIIQTADDAIQRHVQDAFDQLNDEFKTIRWDAADAAKELKKASGFLAFKVVLYTCVVLAVILAPVWYFLVPSLDEIEYRRQEISNLEAHKKDLLQQIQDNDIQITNCDPGDGSSRLCVKINEEMAGTAFTGGYRILYNH